jgi:CubicO group peptidase (beta-lactamase class C family)
MPNAPIIIRLPHNPGFVAWSHGWAYLAPFSELEDLVTQYLPSSVRMPTHNGKEITLRHLVTHTSGLPHIVDNLNPKRADQPFANYTVEELNAFLSGYKLTRDPGTKFEYSSLGIGLLGHAIALKAGTNYESLVVYRICRPLKDESNPRIQLTTARKAGDSLTVTEKPGHANIHHFAAKSGECRSNPAASGLTPQRRGQDPSLMGASPRPVFGN